MYENIKDKRIVIWGMGILQIDIMELFRFKRLLYIINDFKCPSVNVEYAPPGIEMHHPERLQTEDRDNLFVLICSDDDDCAARCLESMGFVWGVNFGFGEDLLINPTLICSIKNKRVHLWGAGNTYAYHKQDIKEYLENIAGVIVSRLDGAVYTIDGFTVSEFSDTVIGKDDFIVVCSIYYGEIAELLCENGYSGKFINIRTFVKMANLSTFASDNCEFDNRVKNSRELLVVLTGYKELVWDSVFPRMKKYVPEHFDVALITAGMVNDKIREICANYNWSYVGTEKNNVSLAVNTAISLHPEAEYIYKMDEDIFVTRGCFEAMHKTYEKIKNETRYEVGFVTPLIPVNGYGYVRLLEIFDNVSAWEERFGELIYTDCYKHHGTIHDSPEAALFMWGVENPDFEDIDTMAEILEKKEYKYSICPIRYSIGLILFKRRDWIRMGMFPVSKHENLGVDEVHICTYCMMSARVMAVTENTMVGHLHYGGPQREAMEEHYRSHRDKFLLKDNAPKLMVRGNE